MIFHDSSPSAGPAFANEFALLKEIKSGRLIGYDLPQNAAGYYLLEDGIHIKLGSNCAILEGAIVKQIGPSTE